MQLYPIPVQKVTFWAQSRVLTSFYAWLSTISSNRQDLTFATEIRYTTDGDGMREQQEPICAELRSEMARQRLKIKDVARELGISPKRIERIVNNSVRLDFITTMRIAEVLNLNPIQLYLLTKTRSQQ